MESIEFSSKILDWYEVNKRDLPWRHTTDPYLIWLSEIILQQTRIEQGLAYYQRFSEKYPTIKDLANASEDEVLKMWQGLGYYSRARNLLKTARTVVESGKDNLPTSYDELIKLKGIGSYTAAAISSFSTNEAQAVVDGNVFRLLSRYFGINTPIDSSQAKNEFKKLAEELMPRLKAGLFNQSMMDFGSLQCRPANPDCANCPLNFKCVAFAEKKVNVLPVKAKKVKVSDRHLFYFFIHDNRSFLLRKRTKKDIWEGLFEFPSIETPEKLNEERFLVSEYWEPYRTRVKSINGCRKYLHKLSHQNLHITFFRIQTENFSTVFPDSETVSFENLKDYGIPRILEKYLQDEGLIESPKRQKTIPKNPVSLL